MLCSYAGKYECIIYAIKVSNKKTIKKQLNEIEGRKRHQDVLFYDKINSKNLMHDHQKPTDLLSFLIEKSTKKGDIIVDPFMGSGATVFAASFLNRKPIAIELNKEIFNNTKEKMMEN